MTANSVLNGRIRIKNIGIRLNSIIDTEPAAESAGDGNLSDPAGHSSLMDLLDQNIDESVEDRRDTYPDNKALRLIACDSNRGDTVKGA